MYRLKIGLWVPPDFVGGGFLCFAIFQRFCLAMAADGASDVDIASSAPMGDDGAATGGSDDIVKFEMFKDKLEGKVEEVSHFPDDLRAQVPMH